LHQKYSNHLHKSLELKGEAENKYNASKVGDGKEAKKEVAVVKKAEVATTEDADAETEEAQAS